MATYADVKAALTPLNIPIIAEEDVHGQRGDTLQISKTGGRYVRRGTSAQHIFHDWEVIARFVGIQTDAPLDALVPQVYDAIKGYRGIELNVDSFEWDYDPIGEGGFRNLLIRFTTSEVRDD